MKWPPSKLSRKENLKLSSKTKHLQRSRLWALLNPKPSSSSSRRRRLRLMPSKRLLLRLSLILRWRSRLLWRQLRQPKILLRKLKRKLKSSLTVSKWETLNKDQTRCKDIVSSRFLIMLLLLILNKQTIKSQWMHLIKKMKILTGEHWQTRVKMLWKLSSIINRMIKLLLITFKMYNSIGEILSKRLRDWFMLRLTVKLNKMIIFIRKQLKPRRKASLRINS